MSGSGSAASSDSVASGNINVAEAMQAVANNVNTMAGDMAAGFKALQESSNA